MIGWGERHDLVGRWVGEWGKHVVCLNQFIGMEFISSVSLYASDIARVRGCDSDHYN